jgi:hypothetical protein
MAQGGHVGPGITLQDNSASGSDSVERLRINGDWQRSLGEPDTQIAQAPEGQPPAGAAMSAGEAARQSANPLGGNFWVMIHQFDNFFLQGDATDDTRHFNLWSFQPVIPFSLEEVFGDHWVIVNRPTIPTIIQAEIPDRDKLRSSFEFDFASPGATPSFGSGFPRGGVPFTSETMELGDLLHFSMVGRSIPYKEQWGGGDFVWAVGPTFQFPTATKEEFGSDKYSAGPVGVLAWIGRKFVVGALGQHWWSYADASSDGNAGDVNQSNIQLFYFYNLPNGWQVGAAPNVTANWSNDGDNRWNVPLGIGVYKTGPLFGSSFPIKVGLEVDYSFVREEALGNEFNIRFSFVPIVPAFFGLL